MLPLNVRPCTELGTVSLFLAQNLIQHQFMSLVLLMRASLGVLVLQALQYIFLYPRTKDKLGRLRQKSVTENRHGSIAPLPV